MHFKLVPETKSLLIELSTMNKLATVRLTDVTIPLSDIESIIAAPPQAQVLFKGLRVGTELPGVITAGTFYHYKDKKDFYFISSGERSIGFKLKPTAEFGNVILDVGTEETPEVAKERLQREIAEILQ
ncbi:hypothetical protein HDV02_005793 [Globomyces sp. JEL0801]|nr:hypothetical protein HDV02_005793 [Globomyces sp. JEL0801]